MAKIIALINQKGGVGKTTVAYHLVCGLYELGYTVLTLDLDPQGNLTATFGKQYSCNALEIFADKPKLKTEAILSNGKDVSLDLVTSNIHLAKAETAISFKTYTKLKNLLSKEMPKNKWSYVIIDCPPSLGIFTVNALAASDYVLIPSLPYYYSLLGLRDLMEVIESVKEEGLNSRLNIIGILLNQLDRTSVTKESMSTLEQNFPELIFKAKIPKTIRVEESIQAKKPIWQYEPSNTASSEFKAFIGEFLRRAENKANG